MKTEVGYSRCFIRQSLNDCLLSSYFQNIKSSAAKKNYYQKHAFVYDADLMDMTGSLLMGIESYVKFDLPCNSSLLNAWNDTALQLSGIYAAPMRSLPISCGEDVAGSLTSHTVNIRIPQKAALQSDIYSASISNSIFSNSPGSMIDEDERMTRLLQKVDSEEVEEVSEAVDDDSLRASVSEELNNLKIQETGAKIEESPAGGEDESIPMGNSLSGRQSWAEPSQQDEEHPDEHVVYNRSASLQSTAAVDNTPFESLWNEKHRKTSSNFKEVWERFEKSLKTQASIEINDDTDEVPEGFEVINCPELHDPVFIQELQGKVETMCRLTTEAGLDSQGFLCNECKAPLGVDFSKATVCGFDSHYYCTNCISPDKHPIPAKIIHNWDFKSYPVCKKAANFLTNYHFKPFIDFKVSRLKNFLESATIFKYFQVLNPEIYYIDEMSRLQKLRIQLNFIRAYIFTCSESTIADLEKLLFAKDYIYQTIHLYSVSDLSLIQNGALEEMLKKIVVFGRNHIFNCALCSVKGFICEFCRKPKVIYPFEIDETTRCNVCGSVSHINCYDSSIPCPKCERKNKRKLLQAEN